MRKTGKDKLKEPLPDSSDEEQAANKGGKSHAAEKRQRREKPPFAKDRCLDALLGDGPNSVRSHLPAHFADGEVEREWREWHRGVAQELSEVPKQERPLPLKMPMKCTATAESVQQPEEERVQKELMVYKNPDGKAYSKDDRDRDAIAARPIRASEASIGSTVAIRRSDKDPWTPGGYGTPFYVGDVTSFVVSSAGSSAESSDPTISKLSVHYRMPLFNGAFCNDAKRPWKLACVAMHAWDSHCETRRACKAQRPHGATTSRVMAEVDATTVFEANLSLKATHALSLRSARNIASSDSRLAHAVGIDSKAKGQQKVTKYR